MPFLIRYHDPHVGHVVASLALPPTSVEYPPANAFTRRTTKDGAVVVQRSLRDSRPRKWVWRGLSARVPGYDAQWALLASLESRARWLAGNADQTVEVWENESGTGGFARLLEPDQAPDLVTYDNLVFTRVRILQADRKANGGGPVSYEASAIEFVIQDDGYTTF